MSNPAQKQTPEARRAYDSGDLYATSKICLKPGTDLESYAGRLLAERLQMVTRHYRGGPVLDLCCATGDHLFSLAALIDAGVGLDFSHRYIQAASTEAAERQASNVTFVQGDATAMPFRSGEFGMVYSFSALYTIPAIQSAVAEIARVLRDGGRAVLDFGNRLSLNAYCLRFYPEWPPVHPITVPEMRRLLQREGLHVVEQRCFQLLPLWAGRPSWLRPLLHPVWNRIMSRRLAGRMLDERVSSLPLLRRVAFRHILVCERRG